MKVLKSGDVVMFEDKLFNIHMTTETAKEVLEGLKKVLDVTATTDNEELSKSKRKIVDIGKGITFKTPPGHKIIVVDHEKFKELWENLNPEIEQVKDNLPFSCGRCLPKYSQHCSFHVTPGSFNCRKILGIEEKDNE